MAYFFLQITYEGVMS